MKFDQHLTWDPEYRVTVNGQEQQYVYAADEEAGYARILETHWSTEEFIPDADDPSGSGYRTIELKGKVEIEKIKADPEPESTPNYEDIPHGYWPGYGYKTPLQRLVPEPYNSRLDSYSQIAREVKIYIDLSDKPLVTGLKKPKEAPRFFDDSWKKPIEWKTFSVKVEFSPELLDDIMHLQHVPPDGLSVGRKINMDAFVDDLDEDDYDDEDDEDPGRFLSFDVVELLSRNIAEEAQQQCDHELEVLFGMELP